MSLRRSKRHHPTTYDANGRDYLASKLGCTREELERWVLSPTVQPHLKLWYKICILGRRRYRQATQWITAGQDGYFYNDHGLEEDLMLTCLGEGNRTNSERESQSIFSQEAVPTSNWSTLEIWARTAWRLVQSNSSEGQVFHATVVVHPAACYGLTIDMLCIAFHSIAFRNTDSAWHLLITHGNWETHGHETGASSPTCYPVSKKTQGRKSEARALSDSSETASRITSEACTNSDVSIFEPPKTPIRAKNGIPLSTPHAPKKSDACAITSLSAEAWVDRLLD